MQVLQGKTYVLEIEGKFPGGNEIKNMQGWKYGKLRDKVRKAISQFFLENGRPVIRGGLAFIQFERTYRSVPQDHENFTLTGKPWFDILEELGVIENDSDKFVKRRYVQEKGKAKVVMRIKRWEESDPSDAYVLVE